MDITLLTKIANTLLINVQYYNNIGLLKGRLGTVLFLYHFSRYIKSDLYTNFSDGLMDIENMLGKNNPTDFMQGISGIGWGIDYLIKNNFVDADHDVLEEIDKYIDAITINTFIREMKSDIPIFSKGLYFLQRGLYEFIYKSLLQCEELLKNHSMEIPLAYVNSMLYVINRVMLTQDGLKGLCESILSKLFLVVKSNIAMKEPNSLDSYSLNRNIRNILDTNIRNSWKSLLCECIEPPLREIAWVHFIYAYDDEMTGNINIADIQESIIDLWNSSPEELCLYNGLTGIGLEMLRNA